MIISIDFINHVLIFHIKIIINKFIIIENIYDLIIINYLEFLCKYRKN